MATSVPHPDAPCPRCGYCPTCKRANPQQVNPWPWYPTSPWTPPYYYQPYWSVIPPNWDTPTTTFINTASTTTVAA